MEKSQGILELLPTMPMVMSAARSASVWAQMAFVCVSALTSSITGMVPFVVSVRSVVQCGS